MKNTIKSLSGIVVACLMGATLALQLFYGASI